MVDEIIVLDEAEVVVEVIEGRGPAGPDGLSAYEVAVENGFEGTEEEWLDSLVGEGGPGGGVALGETSDTAHRGDHGKIAYDHSQETGNPHGTDAADVGADPAGSASTAQAAAIAAASTDATTKANAAQAAAIAAAAADATSKADAKVAQTITNGVTTTAPSQDAVFDALAGKETSGSAAAAQAVAIQRTNHTGTQSADTVVDGTTNHVFTAADDTKLAGIATGATANQSDATTNAAIAAAQAAAIASAAVDATSKADAKVAQSITNGVTTTAPSQDVVFDALALKADLVAGKVPSAQLPSYVDDVLEFANLAAFPATGDSGVIYVAADSNLTYRWSGSAYVGVGDGVGGGGGVSLGETSTTAHRGDHGKIAYDHSQDTGNPHSTTAADVGADAAGSAAAAQAAAVQRTNHTGTQSADTIVDGSTNHVFTAADDTKLAGIATGATANQSDATTNAAIAAKVADAINDGTTTVAPSQNAVFDALAGKETAGAAATAQAAAIAAAASDATTKANAAEAAAIAAAATDATTKANAKVADAINNGTTTVAPSQNAVFDALATKSDTSHNHAGVYDPAGSAATAESNAIATAAADATTKANAKVADAINDGTTTVAPSQNAVFDALVGKETAGAAATAQAAAIAAASSDATTKANAAQAAAVQRTNHTGTQSADTVVDGSTNKVYTATEQTKLAGIATGATANQSDATTNAAIAAKVTDAIADGVTTVAPSQNIVYDALTAVDGALALKAPLASPALTGTPTAPTPTAGDDDTSIATTAFVKTAVDALPDLDEGSGITLDTIGGITTISQADSSANTLRGRQSGTGAPVDLAVGTATVGMAVDSVSTPTQFALVTPSLGAAANGIIPADWTLAGGTIGDLANIQGILGFLGYSSGTTIVMTIPNQGVYTSTVATLGTLLTAVPCHVSSVNGQYIVNAPSKSIILTDMRNETRYIAKAGDTARDNTATATADPELTLALPINTVWDVRGIIAYTVAVSGDTCGLRIGFNLPTGATMTVHGAGTDSTYSGSSAGSFRPNLWFPNTYTYYYGGSNTTTHAVQVSGTITMGNTAGSATAYWAQRNINAGNPTTLKAGSFILARRIS